MLSRLPFSASGLTPPKAVPTPPMELILIGLDLENLDEGAGELGPDPGMNDVALLPDGGVITSFFLKLNLSRMLNHNKNTDPGLIPINLHYLECFLAALFSGRGPIQSSPLSPSVSDEAREDDLAPGSVKSPGSCPEMLPRKQLEAAWTLPGLMPSIQ